MYQNFWFFNLYFELAIQPYKWNAIFYLFIKPNIVTIHSSSFGYTCIYSDFLLLLTQIQPTQSYFKPQFKFYWEKHWLSNLAGFYPAKKYIWNESNIYFKIFAFSNSEHNTWVFLSLCILYCRFIIKFIIPFKVVKFMKFFQYLYSWIYFL